MPSAEEWTLMLAMVQRWSRLAEYGRSPRGGPGDFPIGSLFGPPAPQGRAQCACH